MASNFITTDAETFVDVEDENSQPEFEVFDEELQIDVGSFKEKLERLQDENEYERPGSDPGLLVIFNQVKFDDPKHERRKGSNRDVNELIQTFGRLGFNVSKEYIFLDLSRKEISERLSTIASEDNSHRNCLVVVVLTHGEQGNLIMARDASLSTSEIWEPFFSKNCPSFKNKPKLFFIQACKGNNFSKTDSASEGSDIISRQFFTTAFEPDILVAFSAVEGNRSYRHLVNGTWFVQELCKNFSAYGRRDDVVSLLLRTTKCVAHTYYHLTEKKGDVSSKEVNELKEKMIEIEKQMPLVISTLTKKAYLTKSKDRHAMLYYLQQQQEQLNVVKDIKNKVDLLFKDHEERSSKVTRKPSTRAVKC